MYYFLQNDEMCVKQLCILAFFSNIQLYICFKMFMTCMMRYVILAKMKTN